MLNGFMKFVSGKWSNVNVSEVNPLPVNIIGGGGSDLSILIVEDSTSTKYLRREVIDESGVITISYENFDGSAATPIAPITVASTLLPIGASTSAKQDELRGTQGTGASYDPPTGGSGVFGWLSGIYKEIVSGTKLKLGGTDVSSSNPLPVAQTGYANEGAAITSQPVPIGLEGRTSSKTSVASGQAVRPISTVDGRQVIRLNSIPENEWVYAAASGGITNTNTAVTLVAAQAAGVRNYLTSMQLSSDALGAATEIAIRDGAGGTVLWRGKIGTAGIAGVITIQFSDPLKSTAATLLEVVTLSASVFGGVYVNAQGYIAP